MKILFILLFAVNLYAQYIPIDSVRQQNANGVPILLGQTVTVRGVVSMSQELGSPLVYFQDPTAGLVGYDGNFWNQTNAGDSIQVTGVVTQFNGLTELQPVNQTTVLATGLSVSPQVVTTTQIRVNGEDYEGELIRINNITAVKNTSGVPVTQWTVSGSGTNYRIFSGGDSCDIRIYAATNIANSPVPPFPFSVIALGSQFDSSPPYNSGYQILPRSLTDFIVSGGGPLLSQITYTNIQTSSITITWQTSAPADSKVRWMASDSNYQSIAFTDSVYSASQVNSHSMNLTNLQPGRIYIFNVTSADSSGSTTSPYMYFATGSTSAGTINVYFNKSVDTTLNTGEQAQGNVNFQTKLLQRINAAQFSIDMCLYSFSDLTQIKDALINAKIRGVTIRFVYDSRTNQPLVNDLIAAGIPIQKRNMATSDIMHNKFFVFDYRNTSSANDDWVWTGSTNITQSQFFQDANNVIEIQDQTLAAVYTREFEEMWGSATNLPIPSRAKFGPFKTDNVPHKCSIGGTIVEVYFSPGDNPSVPIENLISNETDQSIYFSAYAFTRCSIHNRIKTKFDGGKDVRGVFDDGNGNDPVSVYRTMKGLTGGGCPPPWSPAGDVWLDGQSGLLHHKYILIDAPYPSSSPVTETGSFNFSNAATFDNDENFLLIRSPRVTNLYLQEFYKRYTEGGGQGSIGIQQVSGEVPSGFSLSQNYPNPFNPITNFELRIANLSQIRVQIFDVTGRNVSTIINEKMNPGTYKVSFDASGLSSGVYFYTLESDGVRIDSKRMVVVK